MLVLVLLGYTKEHAKNRKKLKKVQYTKKTQSSNQQANVQNVVLRNGGKYHTVGTIPKFNLNIVESEKKKKKSDTYNTYTHDQIPS